MIPFYLITGFLGSGKTSLLQNILNEIGQEYRIAVIQNEFAPTGIDGSLLKRDSPDFKLIEINNGSVFCVCQLSNFVQNLQQLISDYQPEMIFLEASGLADPISVVELLQTKELTEKVTLDKSMCVVDAVNYFRGLSTLVRFKHQVMIADLILLNKIDLCSENIDAIKDSLLELNPFAEIQLTKHARLKWKDLNFNDKAIGTAASRYLGYQSEGRPEMNACVLRTHNRISEAGLKAFVKELQATCPRIKGYINLIDGRLVSIHSVYDRFEMKELKGYCGQTELIAFGDQLLVGELRKTFKKYVERGLAEPPDTIYSFIKAT